MTPQEYQEKASRTESMIEEIDPTLNTRLIHSALGLQSESGEIADTLKKHIYYHQELDKPNLKEELGDVLWYVALMCNTLEFSLEDVMDSNIRKLQKRFPDQFDTELVKEENRDRESEASCMTSTQKENVATGIPLPKVHQDFTVTQELLNDSKPWDLTQNNPEEDEPELDFQVGDIWEISIGNPYEVTNINGKGNLGRVPKPIEAKSTRTGVVLRFTKEGWFGDSKDDIPTLNLVKKVGPNIMERASSISSEVDTYAEGCFSPPTQTEEYKSELETEEVVDASIDGFNQGMSQGFEEGVKIAKDIAELMDGKDRKQALKMIQGIVHGKADKTGSVQNATT